MILVDSSVWIDHLHTRDPILVTLLENRTVLVHPFVVGEIPLGHLKQRDLVLSALQGLPAAQVASHLEVLHLIRAQRLSGLGIGYVDAHLVASVRLIPDSFLWTRDKRLHAVVDGMGLAARHLGSSNGVGP